MKALVTGITGFAGSHLAELLLSKNCEVTGLSRGRRTDENVRHLAGKIDLVSVDVCNERELEELIGRKKPDVIFHLAGEASAHRSLRTPSEALLVNVVGSMHLVEAVRKRSANSKLIIVTSSEVYGNVEPHELPLTEKSEFRPVHPYGVSKVALHYVGYEAVQAFGLNVVEARAFNHIGPRQGLDFVVPDFSRQLAEIMLGRQTNRIDVGDLSVERDFVDVRDVVRAYWMLAEKGNAGEVYQICSGTAHSIQFILDSLIRFANVQVSVSLAKEKIRPARMPKVIGSYEKIHEAVGWTPRIRLEESLQQTLTFWVEKLQHTSD